MSDHIEHQCPACGSLLHQDRRCTQTEAEKTALFELEKAVEGANQFNEYQKEILESTKFIFDALELEVDKNKVHDLVCEIGDVLNARNPKMGTVMLALAELLRHGLVEGIPTKKERKEFLAALFLLVSKTLEAGP